MRGHRTAPGLPHEFGQFGTDGPGGRLVRQVAEGEKSVAWPLELERVEMFHCRVKVPLKGGPEPRALLKNEGMGDLLSSNMRPQLKMA
jgi:hypothetical protein